MPEVVSQVEVSNPDVRAKFQLSICNLLHTLFSPVCHSHVQVEAERAPDAGSSESGRGQQP